MKKSESINPLILLTALLLGPLVVLNAAESKPDKHNVLIILSDDQEHCELGSYMDIAAAETLWEKSL